MHGSNLLWKGSCHSGCGGTASPWGRIFPGCADGYARQRWSLPAGRGGEGGIQPALSPRPTAPRAARGWGGLRLQRTDVVVTKPASSTRLWGGERSGAAPQHPDPPSPMVLPCPVCPHTCTPGHVVATVSFPHESPELHRRASLGITVCGGDAWTSLGQQTRRKRRGRAPAAGHDDKRHGPDGEAPGKKNSSPGLDAATRHDPVHTRPPPRAAAPGMALSLPSMKPEAAEAVSRWEGISLLPLDRSSGDARDSLPL